MSRKASRPHPNAAPPDFVAALQSRADRSGVSWSDAIRRAGLGRQSAWRLSRGTASLATARRVEAVIEEVERLRGVRPGDRLAEWIAAGRDLLASDPERFRMLLTLALHREP
ncbi:MAG TPA: hypothetical protein VFO62_10670 [Candidatus Binatia bacterium]|nr:hypothetical protein [Candidatus Binatia bacterium]